MKKYIAAAALITLLALLLAACAGGNLPRAGEDGKISFEGFTLAAETSAPYGTAPDSAFILYTPGDYSVSEVERMLSVEPAFGYKVEEREDGSFRVTPDSALELGREYSFKLNPSGTDAEPRSFAFTVVRPFALLSTYPKDGAPAANADLAAEFVFTMPVNDMEKYFSCEPALTGTFKYIGNKAVFMPDYDQLQPGVTYTMTLAPGIAGVYGGELAEKVSVSFTVGDTYSYNAPYELSNGWNYNASPYYETFLPDECPMADIRSNGDSGKGGDSADGPSETEFTVKVHALASADDYLYYIYQMRETQRIKYNYALSVDTTDLPEAASFTQKLDFSTEFAQQNGFAYLVFPEALPNGWYVATITAPHPDGAGEVTMQKLIQVSPITYYQQTWNGEGVLWLNSGETGEPVAQNTIELRRDPTKAAQGTVVTDENGLAVFALPEPDPDEPRSTYDGDPTPFEEQPLQNDYAFYYNVVTPEGTLANVANSEKANDKTYQQKYYTFLYTDRSVYKQTDRVEFWGIVQPRGEDIPALDKVKVTFEKAYDGGSFLEQTLDVGEDGTFRGSFDIEDAASGYYQISFGAADSDMERYQDRFSRYVSVYQYKKPDYTYSAETDREFYNYNDSVTAKFTASFFDGTPASGMKFVFNAFISDPWYGKGYGGEQQGEADSTDKNGEITRILSLPELRASLGTQDIGWRPAELTVGFENQGAEDSTFTMQSSVRYFPSDTMVRTESETKDGKATLTVRVNKIDLSRLEKFEDWDKNDYELITGEPAVRDVKVEIYHSYSVKTQTGTYYDPYTKSTVPSYTYEWREDLYGSFNKTTGKDGSVTLTGLPASGDGDSYYAQVTVTDGLGSALASTQYLGDDARPYYSGKGYDTESSNFTFNVTTSVEKDEYSYYSWSPAYFNAGDEIKVELQKKGQPVEAAEGARWILNTVQNSVTSVSYLNGESATLNADEKLFPNFLLCGAYFDGRRVYAVESKNLYLNTESMELDVSVDTNAESFLPGGELSVCVTVLDKDGKPQKNAAVCLGVVNEAVFAVEEQHISILSDLYGSCYDPYPLFSTSFNDREGDPNTGGGGKGGGGGDGAMTMRANFKDTVGVETGVTDASGKAEFTFALPDDLTSWRLTAIALSEKREAGTSRSNVVTTLPFFVRPIMNAYTLEGEQAALMLRAFGTGVTDGAAVGFTVSVDGGAPESFSGKVGGYAPVSLGKLSEGEHKIKVTGRSGSYSDGVERTITVVKSPVKMELTSWFELGKDEIDIVPQSSPVTVTLTNSDWEPFLKAAGIVDAGWTERGDEKLARQLSGKALAEFYGGTAWLYGAYLEEPSVENMVLGSKGETAESSYGLLKLLPYGGEDIIFTCRAAVAAPKALSSYGIDYNMRNVLAMGNSGELALDANERAALIMGVSAYQYFAEGDITQEQIFYWDDTDAISADSVRAELGGADVPVRAKCYYITALAYFDKQGAAELYGELIAPLLRDDEHGRYIPAAGEERAVTVTAAALMAALKSGVTDDTAAMVSYIAEKQGSIYARGDSALEAAMFLNEFEPKRSAAPVVSYALDGKRQNADLDKARAVRFAMTKEEFLAADFKLESGTATMQVDHSGDPADAGFVDSGAAALTREFVSESEGLGGATAIVYHINFSSGADYGYYRLTDWIPSNLRARVEDSWNEEIYADYGGIGYYSSFDMENQLFNGYLWYGEGTGRSFTIVLRAQNVIEGEALTAPAYLIDVETMKGTVLEGGESFSWK